MTNRCAVFMAVVFLSLAGCASDPSVSGSAGKKSAAPRYNLTGYPPAFKEGYTDACASPRKRSEQRFRDDADYRMGWQDGSSMCKR